MTLDKISNREQVLIFIVIATFFVGGYVLFRYLPEQKKMNELQATVTANLDKVKNPVFPDEPFDNIETLRETIAELTTEVEALHSKTSELESNLAPTDSQDMIVKVSEVARASGVRVIENIPYIVKGKEVAATAQAAGPKLSKRAQRKADKLARKYGNNTPAPSPVAGSAVGAAPKEGELIYRLVNELDTARPFQRISIEGSYADLQKFIQALRTMPWQATIVKLDIDVAIQTPPQGLPQPLTAKMIVAL